MHKRFATIGQDLTAFIAGATLVSAFSPWQFYALAFLSPAILFALWHRDSTARAIWHGLLYGFGLFGFGVYWVFVSFRHFAHLGSALALTLTLLFILVLATFPAMLGVLYTRLVQQRDTLYSVLFLPAGWTLLEWMRSWVFTGFPWLSLGYSQMDSTLAALAPVTGIFGVSYATVLVAATTANLFISRKRENILLAIIIPGLLWTCAACLSEIQWTRPQSPAVSVALLQGNISQDRKWRPEQRLDTEDLYMEMIESQIGKDIIVLPETSLPEFRSDAEPLLEAIHEEAISGGSAVLIGIPVDDTTSGNSYNGILALGNASGIYFKHHLVPFGEYLPLKSLFPGLIRLINTGWSDFSPGPAHQPPLTAAGQRIGTTICYEDAYPEQVARLLPTANVLVNVSNDAWFGHTPAPYQHLQISRMLALALGRPLLRAANTGVSAIIGHDGHIQTSAAIFEYGIVEGTIQTRTGSTPYVRFGNWPILLLACLAITAGLLRARGKKMRA